ncbi:DUF459 domain-containing protein [Bartonella sp. 220]|uniref:SGNH/GDSL hydrolase family protein n=1 Tax=Bartonella sp. 220B TaxID=2967260 RepID=UPI0022A9F6A5|nr:SGNH family hydrolase [Bartonella sp. 220B]MCZ2158018.1 DUF459 domain-containing protein [Bartonella sp. 220B]
MSYFRSMHLIFLFFFLFAVSVMQPSSSKATNFFKWLLEHNKQEKPQQQPQMIEQKRYKPQKKIVTQKSVKKLKKEENAQRILVLGDFVASAVAEALKEFFTDKSNIIIINNTIPDSGLVRTDHTPWKNNISEIIEKNKPDVIIMVIGANDNQSIITPQGIFSTNEPEWLNNYKQRIIEIAESLHTSRKPWIWMGQPIFKNENLTQKMKIFNELYKREIEGVGGYFIDIWDGFTNEQGQFSFSGYDINGKITRLRTNDGINFTFEGKRKLVSYLRKPLETILNLSAFSHEDTHLTNANTLQPVQDLRNIERQPPISLDDIAQQNTGLLKKIDQSFIKRLWMPLNGYQKDRADNFSLP